MAKLYAEMKNMQFYMQDFPKNSAAFSVLQAFSSARPSHRLAIFPGFADVHVHLREPGFSYKETIRTGTLAAAHGGYTAVCAMPNLNPVPDCLESLRLQLDKIRYDAVITVLPYGAVTVGEKGVRLAQLEEMAPFVAGFSDDGKGVQDESLMEQAMRRARTLNLPIAAHCEDERQLKGGYIHDGAYARAHGHRGICAKSEWEPIRRDLELVRKTGCAYHVCHVSAAESVALLRRAKAEGLNVSCETAPHYLVLDDSMLQENGRFKMNPPLRSAEDRLALLEGLRDGTIDCIATDHAPHTAEEKSGGLEKSLMGVVGLETAFPVLYTALVKPGALPLETLLAALTERPRHRFRITADPGWTVFDLDAEYTVDPGAFLSMGRATPFDGMQVFGQCLMTVQNNRIIWQASK